MAGKEGERLSEVDCEETDMALARLYAGTVCISAGAVAAFVAFAEVEARELLKARWHAVETVARALLERETLTGEEIDGVIFEAEKQVELQSETRFSSMAQ